MTRFEVLSIHPQTKSPERMPFATHEEAKRHKRRTEAGGRLLVTIVSSLQEREEWRQNTKALLAVWW